MKLVLDEALKDLKDMDGVFMDVVPLQRSKHSAVNREKGINIMKLSSNHNVRIMVLAP